MNGETYTALCHDQQNLHSSALRIPIRIRAWLHLSIILLLSLQNCSSPVKPDQAGITVATANLLIGNTQGKTRVTESLLSRSADVLVLNEACPATNIDTVMLRDAGYQFKFLAGSSGAFSILMASKISAQFVSIHMSYPVGYDMHLSMQYQENFEIPGSDHRGVMVWIDFFN